MQIIREKVQYTGEDSIIKIRLNNDHSFFGHQQDVNSLVDATKSVLINPVFDEETRRLKLYPDDTRHITFAFSGDNVSFLEDGAGFTLDELTGGSKNVVNSFFIATLYDSYDPNTQTKLSTTYLTKIGTEPDYGLNRTVVNQFKYITLPQWFLDERTHDKFNIYLKLSFYNAKLGKLHTFYNNLYPNELSSRKMYFEIKIDPTNRLWVFTHTNIVASELLDSQEYLDNINSRISKSSNIIQSYPEANTFSYLSGKYET
jgi:hypothetical protein